LADALVVVDLVNTDAINTWIVLAFIDVHLTVLSAVSGRALADEIPQVIMAEGAVLTWI
jgi:hypothetical protein